MNLLSIVITGIFVVLSGAFLVLLVVSISGNVKTGKRYRESIKAQLSKLRLAKMLGIQGIEESSYLHSQPILDIRDQMQRCSACTNTEECDQLLEEGVGDQAEFCDNDTTLKQVKERIDQAS